MACMWRKLCKKFFGFELKTPSRFYFCSSCSCVLFFLFHFTHSTKMILKFRESTISRLERLRQREKEGSDTQEDGREREIVSEKNELLSHSYLSLTFFFTNVFLCCTTYPTCMLVFPFGSNFLKRKFLS